MTALNDNNNNDNNNNNNNNNKHLLHEVFAIAGIIKADVDNTHQDHDYLGYHKN